jgi:hypothetical protein
VFTITSAILVPASTLVDLSLNPTVFAGGTLAMLYLTANPQLLLATPAESKELIRRGPVLPLALYLGGLLMIVGLFISWIAPRAT